jgi:hypothetical protein
MLIPLGAVLGLIQVPTAAAGETIIQGPWSLSGSGGTVTFASPAYVSTTGKAYSCVQTTSFSGQASGQPGSWRYALIWDRHGKTVVVFKSRWYTATGTHCSPVREPTERRARFFDKITMRAADGTSAVSGSGLWDLYLDL